MSEHRFKEIRERPPEKARRWRRAIQSATIKVVQDRPHLVSTPRQAPLVMVHLGQIPVAPFHGRGGPLKDLRPLQSPCVPLRQSVGGEPPGVTLHRVPVEVLERDGLDCLEAYEAIKSGEITD